LLAGKDGRRVERYRCPGERTVDEAAISAYRPSVTAGRPAGTAGTIRDLVVAIILALVGSLGVFAYGTSPLQIGGAALVGVLTSLVGGEAS
jgi:hypothetical protein